MKLLILRMGILEAGHLPVFFSIIFTFMLGLTYIFAVFRGDVDPLFPYISAAGDLRPESCVFSALLNICSFLTLLIACLRYGSVLEINQNEKRDVSLNKLNRAALYFGLLGGFGMFIVANFQDTALHSVHLLGAVSCFGFGAIYMLLQSMISYRLQPVFCNKLIAHIRLLIAVLSVIFFITAISFGISAASRFHQYFPDLPVPHPWTHKFKPMPGYTLHCVSSVSEWILAVLQVAFILTFSHELEDVRVELVVTPLISSSSTISTCSANVVQI